MATFTTAKGTALSLMDLKGKLYMSANNRLRWFREEHPLWSIETDLTVGDKSALCKSTIKDETGRVVSQAHGYEDAQGFEFYREKSETASVARALNHLGYGTQFDEDLDASGKPADAPVETMVSPMAKALTLNGVITFGKYKDRTVSQAIELDGYEKVASYAAWLESSAASSGKSLSASASNFIAAVASIKRPTMDLSDDVAL